MKDDKIEQQRVRDSVELIRDVLPAIDLGQQETNSHFRAALGVNEIEILFDDTNSDPQQERIKRYLINKIKKDELEIEVVSNPKETGYAAGTAWHDSIIQVLADSDIIGRRKLKSYGSKKVIRSIIAHEAYHVRIYQYLYKWLTKNNVPNETYWIGELRTTNEEYLARLFEQKSLGHVGIGARVRAFISTIIDAGSFPPICWQRLERVWEKQLAKRGLKIPLKKD